MASGVLSWSPGGAGAELRGIRGAFAWGSKLRAVTGDCQTWGVPLGVTTTDDTATIITSDRGAPSSTNVAVLPDNCHYAFDLIINARSTGGDVATWRYHVSAKRGANAAATSVVDADLLSTHVESGLTGVTATVVANTTRGSVEVSIAGLAATAIDWYAQMMGGQLVR